MIIKRILIKNFRSYYGEKVFEFSNHLNLILGSNGDGKTTFFDAVNWALATTENDSMRSTTLVSAKMFSELAPGGTGEVKVSIDMVNKNNQSRCIEKSFNVTKELDGRMLIDNYAYIGYITTSGSRRSVPARDVLEKEGLFPAVIKKYCLFRGESELNVFNNKTTLKELINLYSDVKDFDPFKDFASTAVDNASKAKLAAEKKQNSNNDAAAKLGAQIETQKTILRGMLEREKECKITYETTEDKIKAIESDLDTIELVNNIQSEINVLSNERDNLAASLDEQYSIKLLDDLWILYGFQPILEEYSKKTADLSQKRQALLNKHIAEQAKKAAKVEVQKEIEDELERLPWFIPNIETMKQMVDAHRCKVCNTPAPEGSAAYIYMKKRLDEALAHLNPEVTTEEEETEQVLFENNYIDEIYKMSIALYDYGDNIAQLGKTIQEKFSDNAKIQSAINERIEKIQTMQSKIAEIVAQSASGEDVGAYLSLWTNIKNWYKNKEDAALDLKDLAKQIPEKRKEIEELEEKYNKTMTSVQGKLYVRLYNFFNILNRSIERAEASSFSDFLKRLQDEANKYLALLNVDDFTGEIHIFSESGNVKLYLFDSNNKRIERPNTSLETTMHISVLLAISELTKENRDNEYPLIFDAPTSTFDEGKDRNFYECLNTRVDKQCIVVTKSYLTRNDADGVFVVNEKELAGIKCPVYRISKRGGFNKKDLSTIETVVTPIVIK